MGALPGISLHSSKGFRGVQEFTYQKWSLKRSVFNSVRYCTVTCLGLLSRSVRGVARGKKASPTRTRLTSIPGNKVLLARGLDHTILSFFLDVHVMLILMG